VSEVVFDLDVEERVQSRKTLQQLRNLAEAYRMIVEALESLVKMISRETVGR